MATPTRTPATSRAQGRPVVFFYDEAYNYGRGLPLKQAHGFVLNKAQRIHDHLVGDHRVAPSSFARPEPVSESALHRVHAPVHLAALRTSAALAKATEFAPLRFLPAPMARRAVLTPQLRATDGTVGAFKHAAAGGWAFNLAGGFHHARPSLAHGFCLIADVAVAVAAADVDGDVVVLDLDTHHGDGNAVALAGRKGVLTVSMHEGDAFPHPKPASGIDWALPAGVDDAAYLAELELLLAEIDEIVQPSVVVYLAGTDVLASDPLGSQALTPDGVLTRDRRVAEWTRAHAAGFVALPAGGYSEASPHVTANSFAAMAAIGSATGR